MSSTIQMKDLPSQYDARSQHRWYRFWEERGYFHSAPDPTRKPYTIVIPPPNVTGALHLGHALNNSLQDILIRFRRMQGYNTLWLPGTDHAGIATQAVVERRLFEEENITRHDLGRKALVERIWSWKREYEARILGQLKQLGCSCDWERTRFTLDDTCARAVRHTFFRLFRQQLIYRGKRLVNWDTFLQTTVSDDEVFHETVQGYFWHFHYPIIDPRPGEPTRLTIATTRPETMLGDTAVAVHPDPAAALDRADAGLRDKLAAAPAREKEALTAQLEALAERRATQLPELLQLRDMALDGRKVMLPLLDREMPLITDEWAKPELGSGCVKITPAHDINDYEVGRRRDLPMINILNTDGTLNANAGPYQGLKIEEARRRVVADLESAGLLGPIEDREIDLAHSDRSKTPIEPYLADQWFVRMDRLAQLAMDAVSDGRVRIFPERYVRGYLDWLSEKRDWPVGRQLWWGHRMPIWSRRVSDAPELERLIGELDADPDLLAGQVSYQVEQVAHETAGTPAEGKAAEGAPADGAAADGRTTESMPAGGTASDETASDLPHAILHLCIEEENAALEARFEEQGYVREEDVLDTWFSSALWPHSTLGWPEQTPELDYYYPTSTLITSRDIITLWVARMVLTGLHNMNEIPFHEVYIHPKILDGYGESMSKSKGNGVDPLDVIEKFGADALRFGLAYLTTETQDVRLPVEFECPHCQTLMSQTRENRKLPRIDCAQCGKPFSTQWADKPEDQELLRGAVVSERFELGRNFCNKLWNAARFALINLEGYDAAPVTSERLAIEDRWILSRLATVSAGVTDALVSYRYADAARMLYDFAWDEFCSFYLEMIKGRLQQEETRADAQRVLAHTLDALLRLLHPMIPFITEEIWQLLAQVAPARGLRDLYPAAESIMIADWPEIDAAHRDTRIEEQFAGFQAVLSGVRDIRRRQNIPPRKAIRFSVRCAAATAAMIEPMATYFESLAWATTTAWGPGVEPPVPSANVSLPGIEIFVDLEGLIDIEAELERNEKEHVRLVAAIGGKEKKLANEKFISRAPAAVVQRERDGLADLQQQLASVETTLAALRKQS